MQNLDISCARLGEKFASLIEDENILTTSLGVLEEQGMYAFFLYLKADKKRNTLFEKCIEFLLNNPNTKPLLDKNAQDASNHFQQLQKLSENLDNLLLAQDLLRQSLVYGRYHAKAKQNKEEQSK